MLCLDLNIPIQRYPHIYSQIFIVIHHLHPYPLWKSAIWKHFTVCKRCDTECWKTKVSMITFGITVSLSPTSIRSLKSSPMKSYPCARSHVRRLLFLWESFTDQECGRGTTPLIWWGRGTRARSHRGGRHTKTKTRKLGGWGFLIFNFTTTEEEEATLRGRRGQHGVYFARQQQVWWVCLNAADLPFIYKASSPPCHEIPLTWCAASLQAWKIRSTPLDWKQWRTNQSKHSWRWHKDRKKYCLVICSPTFCQPSSEDMVALKDGSLMANHRRLLFNAMTRDRTASDGATLGGPRCALCSGP